MRSIWIKCVSTMVLCAFLMCGTVSATDTVSKRTMSVQYEKTQHVVNEQAISVDKKPTYKSIHNDSYSFAFNTVPKVINKTILYNKSNNTPVDDDEITTLPTLQEFLQIAIQPVGKTMYVWSGGWNEEDNAAGVDAVSIGVSPQWKRFFTKQTSKYNFNTTRFQIHNGLDCSGYVGWTIYNLFNTENCNDGYVMKATKMAKDFSNRGWGSYTSAKNVKKFTPGSIMSSKGHVYIVLGQCTDGSIVLVHSSPPGVQISGTVSPKDNKNSQAITLATKYMKKYYPAWYKKYPVNSRDKSYLTDYNQMTWKLSGDSALTDPDDIAKMSASQVLTLLFGKKL